MPAMTLIGLDTRLKPTSTAQIAVRYISRQTIARPGIITSLCLDTVSARMGVGHLLLPAELSGTHWAMICVIWWLALTVSDVCLKLGCFQSTSTYSALEVSNLMCITVSRLTYTTYLLTYVSLNYNNSVVWRNSLTNQRGTWPFPSGTFLLRDLVPSYRQVQGSEHISVALGWVADLSSVATHTSTHSVLIKPLHCYNGDNKTTAHMFYWNIYACGFGLVGHQHNNILKWSSLVRMFI